MAKLSILAELIGADRVAEGLAAITEAIDLLEKEQAALQKHLKDTGQAAGDATKPGGGVALLANGLKDVALGFAEGAVQAAAAYFSIQKLFSLVAGGIREFAELERLSLRVEAVFRATGNRAGVTADQINMLANSLSQTTFVTQQAVLQGAASLATFRSVHGEAFERVLRLSQDVSEVMGRDFRGTVINMGRAMDAISSGSVEGMRRAFSFLSPAILETAKQMAEAGKTADAMKYILDETEKSVGGGGAAAHGGLAGSVDSLSKAWNDMWVEIGKIIATRTDLEGWFKSTAEGVRAVLDAFNVGISDDETQLLRAAGTVTRLRDQLKGVRDAGPTAFVGLGEKIQGVFPGGEDVYELNEKRRQARIVQITAELKVAKEEQALLREDIRLRKEKGEADEKLRIQQEKDAAWNMQINELIIEGNQLMAEAAEENRKVGESIRQGVLTPLEKYTEQVDNLNKNWVLLGLTEEMRDRQLKKLKEEYEAAEKALRGKNAAAQQEIQLTDETTKKLATMLPLVEQLTSGYENLTQELEGWVASQLSAAMTPAERMNEELRKLGEADKAGLISPEMYSKLFDEIVRGATGAKEKTDELTASQAYLIATTQNLMEGFGDIITSNLDSAGDAWEAFKNVVLDVGKQILEMIVKLSIINPIMNSVFGTSYSTIGSLFTAGAGSAFGAGGTPYPLPPPLPTARLATGGSRVFTRPTLLSVAEMGPEFVEASPLSGGRGGGGGGGQTIYVDARNSNGDVAVERAVREGLRKALPGFTETAVQMVRQRNRMDPNYLR